MKTWSKMKIWFKTDFINWAIGKYYECNGKTVFLDKTALYCHVHFCMRLRG